MSYERIIRHYEECFKIHGDTPKGADWPNAKDLATRYEVMLEITGSADTAATLLDFGCGTGMLKAYLDGEGSRPGLTYLGLDASPLLIERAKEKFPGTDFIAADVLRDPASLPEADYIVMNGVFTEKRELAFEEMLDYFKALLRIVFPKARKGVAFNVMSKEVDWERDDLFHLPTDVVAGFVVKELSRHFVIRNDYGLYEYTVYLFREPGLWHV